MTGGNLESSCKSGNISVTVKLALAALLILYAIQLHSPLRLNTDAVVILKLTATLTDGQPYLLNGSRPIYPIGVPLTYSLMERAGVANSFGFALFNLVCICLAAYATWIIGVGLGMRPNMRTGIILVSFSSFVLIKHSVIPLTDIPYLTTSLMCCAMLEIYPKKRSGQKMLVLLLAIICLAGSIFARRVGVALIPAVLYAIWLDARQSGLLKTRRFGATARIIIGAGAAAVIAGAAAIALRHLLYLPDFHFGGSVGQAVVRQISMRANDFGELLTNAPVSKVPRLHPLILAAGVLLAVLIGMGFWRTRRHWHATHVYFLAYLAILAIWPFGDARFWLPVLPLIAILVFQAIAPTDHPVLAGRLIAAYLAVYAGLALIALVYTTAH